MTGWSNGLMRPSAPSGKVVPTGCARVVLMDSSLAAGSDFFGLPRPYKPTCPLLRGHLLSSGSYLDGLLGAEAGKRVVIEIEDFAQDFAGVFA